MKLYRFINILVLIGCFVWFYLEPGVEPVIAFLVGIAAFFRDDIQGVIGLKFISLTPKRKLIRSFKNLKYSFIEETYINPAILEDLNGWISDSGDQIVSISVTGSNKSNRYFGKISVTNSDKNYPWVSIEIGEKLIYYQYIGCTFSGIHLIRLQINYGGSGTFCNVLLLTVSSEPAINIDEDNPKISERFIIKKIGSIGLGDRYEGNLSYKFGFLTIPGCSGLKTLRNKKSRIFIL